MKNTVIFYLIIYKGPGVIRWLVNGGSVQTVNVNQMGINEPLPASLRL